MSDDEYTRHLQTLGLDPTTFFMDNSGTLVAAPSKELSTPIPGPDADDTAKLELMGTIGEGGMGLVRMARQVALDRHVAVKTVRPELDNAAKRNAVLREAWVTGKLEHPNIVPVHTLGSDEDGRPVFAMKLVEGRPWNEVMATPGDYGEIIAGRALLDFHLDVLEQVCRAISFAHSRGILHRDLKPHNVMLGWFGEVYVVDWGMAASLDDQADFLPKAADIVGVEGTPQYMAPEMAGATPGAIGVPADVYGLGAILHEVLTGLPRNLGRDVSGVLAAAYHCPPPVFQDDVPPLLAEVVRKSTARERRDRYATVEAFRRAIVDYQQHSTSQRLSNEARVLHDELHALMRAGEPDALGIAERAQAARFGYEQALSVWDGNEEARTGLQALLRILFTHELARENRDAAAALMAAMTEVPEELRAGFEALVTRLDAKDKEVLKLQRAADTGVGARRKMMGTLLAAVGGVFGPIAAYIADMTTALDPGWETLFACQLAYMGLVAVDLMRTRKRRHNKASIRQSLVIASGGTLLLTSSFAAWWAGAPVSTGLAISALVAGHFTLILSSVAFPFMAWGVPAYVLGAAGAVFFPEHAWGAFGFSALLAYFALFAAWRQGTR